MSVAVTWRTLVLMLREEWRLHTRLFGGNRFAAFPLFIAGLAVGSLALLDRVGTDVGSVVAGLHALALLFGLQTGAVAFLGGDRLDDLFGETTLLLASTRTLPLSPRRTFGVFLLHDLLYYTGLFLLPLALAVGGYALVAGATVRPLLLVCTLAGVFALGLGLTLSLVGLLRRRFGRPLVGVLAVATGLAVAAGVDLVALTPYTLYRSPSPTTALAGMTGVPVALALGWALYDPGYRTPTRTDSERFDWLHDRLPGDPYGLVARNLLEVHRSGGGFAKPVGSALLVAGVAVGLVGLAERITGVPPDAPVTLGALLGLTAFTTYNWLTLFDDADEYRSLPLPLGALFRAKRTGFALLTLPVGGTCYAGVVVLYGGSPASVVAGAAVFGGLAAFLFGLTVFLAGLDPNAFLFDTVLFSLFGVAVAVALVPPLVVGLVVPVSPAVAVGLGGFALVLAGVGHLLFEWAIPRWDRRLRAD